MQILKKGFSPPFFHDEESRQAAKLLNGILLGSMFISAVFIFLGVVFSTASQGYIIALRSAASFGVAAILFALFRRGHIQLVRNTFLPLFYALVVITQDAVSINHSMTAATCILVVCVGGLVMETRPLSFALALVGVFAILQSAADYRMLESQSLAMKWFAEWGVYVAVLLSAGIIAHYANRRWIQVVGQAEERGKLLEKQYTELRRENTARHMAETHQAVTAGMFGSLSQASEELLKIDSMDRFWRRAIEIAREELGVERCAIFLNTPGTRIFVGTYGTDLEGTTTAEGDLSYESDELLRFSLATERSGVPCRWQQVTDLGDTKASPVHSWTASTPIYTDHGQRAYGIMFNDNARIGAQVDPAQQDALAVYCSMLATIIDRKELANQQNLLLDNLRVVLSAAAPLLNTKTLDELWKEGVEFVRTGLGIERAGIFVRDADSGQVHGTFGTDFSGNTSDEHNFVLQEDGPMLTQIRVLAANGGFQLGSYYLFETERRYYDQANSQVRTAATGWVTITPILMHDGAPAVWMCNDAEISKSTIDSNKQEVLAVFCSLLGNIVERKRLEENLTGLNATLEAKVAERTLQINQRNIALTQEIAERQRAEQVLEQRIRYEKLIAELSHRFMQLAAEDVETSLDFVMQRIGEVTGVEIVRLLTLSDDGATLFNPHEWTAPGIASQKGQLQDYKPDGIVRWWAQQLTQVIYVPDTASPPAAYAQEPVFAEIARRGVKSMLTVPLRNDPNMRGSLCLDTLTFPLTWSTENIQMMQVVAEMIAKALDRQMQAKAAAVRSTMDRLLANIARDLNRTYPEEIDAAIARSLARVGEFLSVDTCRLFEYRENSQAMICVASWLSPLGEATTQPEPAEYESWPWWRNSIHRHGVVMIPDVAQLDGGEHKKAAEYWKSRGVEAALSAPVLRGEQIMGEIAIDVLTGPRQWQSQDLYLLRIATELIVHARERRKTASLLKRERDSLEERVMDRTRVLSSVLDITQTVSSTQTMEALVSLVLSRFKSAIPCDAVLLSELIRKEGDIDVFKPLKSEVGLAHDNRRPELMYDPRLDVDMAACFDNRRPFFLHDTKSASPYAAAFRARFARNLPGSELHIRSVMHAPMIVENQVVGVMTIMSSKPGSFGENEAAIAMAFANQTAALLMRTRMHDRDVYAAALTERSRLARELHDSVSQALFGIVLGSKTVLSIIGASKTPEQDMLREPIQYIYGLSEAALSEMRALIFELRPESLQTEGIIMAFEKQAEMVFARHKIKVRTELGHVEPDLPLNVKEALYRIGSEALQNTIKHAHASVIDIRLAVRQDDVTLDIIDDGAGFDTQAKFKGHYGLHTMSERAIQFGGSVEIESAPHQGTRVRVQFQLKRAGGLPSDLASPQPSAAAA